MPLFTFRPVTVSRRFVGSLILYFVTLFSVKLAGFTVCAVVIKRVPYCRSSLVGHAFFALDSFYVSMPTLALKADLFHLTVIFWHPSWVCLVCVCVFHVSKRLISTGARLLHKSELCNSLQVALALTLSDLLRHWLLSPLESYYFIVFIYGSLTRL